MKTINAQLWRLGAVSLAFALAITMLISTGPTTKGVEAAACVIDITESDGLNTVLVNGAVANTAVGNLTVDTVDAGTAGLGFGSVVKLNTPEFVRISSLTSTTVAVISHRGVVNNISMFKINNINIKASSSAISEKMIKNLKNF